MTAPTREQRAKAKLAERRRKLTIDEAKQDIADAKKALREAIKTDDLLTARVAVEQWTTAQHRALNPDFIFEPIANDSPATEDSNGNP